jgi:hypothetical protein
MTMLGGVLVHPVLFRLFLRVFFHAVQCGVGDYAGDRDRVSHMISELCWFSLKWRDEVFR